MTILEPQVNLVEHGKFPEHMDLNELEALLNHSFGTRKLELDKGYLNKDSTAYPTDLSFLVSVKGKEDEYIGILISQDKEIEGFEFNYYDKIAVHPNYQNNGVMTDLIQTALAMGDKNCNIQPSLLRTSDSDISQKYEKLSDNVTEIGGYFVHGFGFFDKDKGNPLIENAQEKFETAAKYVAALPQTIIPMSY